jgi:DNA repair exonuclease SbcCD ATPase subunit
VKQLEEQLAHAEGAEDRMTALTQQRLGHYAAYFDALLQEESELRKLYEPLEALLSVYGGTTAKLRLTVLRKVDLARWTEQGEDLLDLRGSVFKSGTLKNVAETALLEAWEGGDGQAAAEAIAAFSREHSGDFRRQRKARADDLDGREWERSLSRWLYSAGHIRLNYSLMYDKLRIESLSPGTRGIVLLLLYLAVDRAESDPLIIDQPEENLDPESVYWELVQLFRDASRRRQIIMVTHNANLVVNTDVDQVIVAQCENFEDGKLPELRYTSGGLENPHIRELVCKVLEGGAEAFRQRARRLRISM